MAAAPASTMLSTISLGPAAAPATNTPAKIGQGRGQFGFHGFNEVIRPGGEGAAALGSPTRQQAQGQHYQVMLGHLHPAFGILRFVPDQDRTVIARVKISHLASDKINPHGLGVLDRTARNPSQRPGYPGNKW